MNQREYQEYQASFTQGMARHEVNCLSTTRGEDGEGGEPYFSWRPCSICGCRLGGDRYDCTGFNHTTPEVVDINNVCADCVYYHEYHQLDDATMAEIERDNGQDWTATDVDSPGRESYNGV